MNETERTREHLFHSLFDDTPVIVWITDKEGDFEFVNRASSEFLGLSLQEVQSGGWQKLTHPDDLGDFVAEFMDCLEKRKPFQGEFRLLRADGEWRWIDSQAQPRYSDSGEFLGMSGSSIDITERKQAEQKLAFQAELLDRVHEAVIATDENLIITAWNMGAEKLLGWKSEEAIGQIITSLSQPEWDVKKQQKWLHELHEQNEFQRELIHTTRDGKKIITEENVVVLRDSNGQINGYVDVVRDITGRKQAEDLLEERNEALRASEKRFRVALSNSPIIVSEVDRDMRYTWLYNPHSSFTAETSIGKRDDELAPLPYVQELMAFKRTVLDSGIGQRKEIKVIVQGEDYYYDVIAEPRLDSSGNTTGITVAAYDITEMLKTEALLRERNEALQESELRLNLAKEAAQIGIFDYDVIHDELRWDPRIYELWGAPPDRVINYKGFLNSIHPDDQKPAQMAVEQALDPAGNGQYHAEYRVANEVDQKTRWIAATGLTTFDQGRAVRLTGTVQDITERKQAEEAIQNYAEQLKRSNQELQDFAFVASHDLQEPLRKIRAFSKMIGNHSDLDEQERDYLTRVQDAALRMQKLIGDLLELSRVTTHQKPYEWVDLNRIVQTALEDLEPRIRLSNAQVKLHPLPTIEADPGQMHRLCLNLLGNALKFHLPNTPPVVEIGFQDQLPGKVELYVRDHGIGFDPELVEQIFKPFERLNQSSYEGSGMGLPICKKIIERHGGQIWAESAPGNGSTFFVTLPMKQNP